MLRKEVMINLGRILQRENDMKFVYKHMRNKL